MEELHWNSQGNSVQRVTREGDELCLHASSHENACVVHALLPNGWSVFRNTIYTTLGLHTHEDELERVRAFLHQSPDDGI